MALLDTTRTPDTRSHAQIQADLDATVVCGQGWTHKQLHTAFALVQNERNWKFPISKELKGATKEEAAMIVEAIRYIAGGGARVDWAGDTCLIQAPGYYQQIGA